MIFQFYLVPGWLQQGEFEHLRMRIDKLKGACPKKTELTKFRGAGPPEKMSILGILIII